MSTVLEKRTSENIWYSIDCTDDLDAAETINSITSIAADQGSLAFAGQVANTVAITYTDGRVAAIGKSIQVQISAGIIPAGQMLPDGRAGIQCTIRAKYHTSEGNDREATILLNLTDKAS